MTEEDYFASVSSNNDAYSNRNQPYISSRKENVSRPSKKSPGHRGVPVHHYKSGDPDEEDKRTTFSPRPKSHVHKSSSPTHQQEDPLYAEFDAFQPHVTSTKENVSLGYSKKSLANKDVPVHRFQRTSEEDKRATFSPRVKPHVHKQEDPSGVGKVRDMNLNDIRKQPVLRQKSRQQVQKEKEAATTIQSAWRGHQVRKELDTMDEAATRIQAAFRGHQTRKELSFHSSESGSFPGQKVKRGKSKNWYFPEFLHDSPQKEVFTYGGLDPPLEKQKHRGAASIIQEAWERHQRRQRESSTMLQEEQGLRKSYCSIEKTYMKHTPSGHTLDQVQGTISKSGAVSVRNVPRVRNINIYTIVKGMPVLPKPSVSIHVCSPHGVVEGYQKDLSPGGVHGLYTVKNRHCQRPAQLLIHVNLQKEKGLNAVLTSKCN